MAKKRRNQYQFRPDPTGTSLIKKIHLTRKQWLSLLKWSLLSAVVLLALVIQDVIMSQFRFSGATTDLAVCAILLIGLYEGIEEGGLFALLASLCYCLSGSAPGPYCIGLMTFLGVIAAVLRQVWWRRGLRSTVICAGCALILYEIAIFVIALVSGLAPWSRVGIFLLTALYSCAIMVPLYPLACKIGKIGGEPWKE